MRGSTWHGRADDVGQPISTPTRRTSIPTAVETAGDVAPISAARIGPTSATAGSQRRRRRQPRALRRRARRRSRTICRRSSPLALAAPAERLIGQLPDRSRRRRRLSARRPRRARRTARRPLAWSSACCEAADVRSARRHGAHLAECLALQLKDHNRYDPLIAALLDNLDLLAAHNSAALRRAVGVDMDELADMIAEIRQLNPKPGSASAASQCSRWFPTSSCAPASDGSWIVELNSDTLPRVLVNRSYYTRVVAHRAGRPGQGLPARVPAIRPTGWSRASTSAPARSCASPRRSCASRTASSPMASSTCGRSISRPWRTRSRCTNRRSAA